MLNETMNLKEMIEYRPAADAIETCNPAAAGILKYIFISNEAQENKELLRSLLEENQELFLHSPDNQFFEFSNPASSQSILIGCTECALDEEAAMLELQEYLKDTAQEGTIILDLFVINQRRDGIRLLRRIQSEAGEIRQEVFEINKKA